MWGWAFRRPVTGAPWDASTLVRGLHLGDPLSGVSLSGGNTECPGPLVCLGSCCVQEGPGELAAPTGESH